MSERGHFYLTLTQKQYEYMRSRKANACILHSQIQYCFKKNYAYEKSYALNGTIMCRNKKDVRYPKMRKSEDTIFCDKYALKYGLVTWKNPAYYYVRLIHGYNTWDDNHFNVKKMKENKWLLGLESQKWLRKVLSFYRGCDFKK